MAKQNGFTVRRVALLERRVAVFLAAAYAILLAVGAIHAWGILLIPLVIGVPSQVGVWLTRPKPVVEAAPRWELKAPNPEPGQCPVCGYDDLPYWREMDAWSLREGDERHVQPYGKHEAHRFCKELVPYAAPKPERAPGGYVAGVPFGPLPEVFTRPAHLPRGFCGCFDCERSIDRQAAEVARRLRTEPRLHDPSGLHGQDRLWTCRFCGLQRWAPGLQYAKNQLIEHARHDCSKHRQLGGKYGSRAVDVVLDPAWVGDALDATVRIGHEPPEDWTPFATLPGGYDPEDWDGAPDSYRSSIRVTLTTMPFASWVSTGTVVLFADPDTGVVTEAAEVRMLATTTGVSLEGWTDLCLTAPIERKHPGSSRLLVLSR